jgi:Response regulator containing CheY-like receiver, AAA-type ATPase, and DNA-binding domains
MNSILVVEDEASVRENLAELLTEKNYEVKEAANGKEALDILKKATVDLIITDLMMPIMDGMEFLNNIKSLEESKTIPVIVLSAKSENTILQFCVQNLIVEYISKPYDASLLYNAVAKNLEK